VCGCTSPHSYLEHQVVRLIHQCVQLLAAAEHLLNVLAHDVLHLINLLLNTGYLGVFLWELRGVLQQVLEALAAAVEAGEMTRWGTGPEQKATGLAGAAEELTRLLLPLIIVALVCHTVFVDTLL